MFLDSFIYKFVKSQDRNSFGVKEKIVFFKEVWYLLNGGVGIMEAMQTIGENTDNYALKDIVKDIITDLNGWRALSFSLMKQLEYFDEWDISIIKAWEKTWNLWKIIHSLSKEYQFITQMQNKYVWALTYPVILMVLWFFAIIALFVFVLPWIFDIADQFPGMKLPWITVFLQHTADFMALNRMWIVLGMVVLVLFLSIVFATTFWQKLLFWMIFVMPVLGDVTKSYYLIKLSRYSKIMMEAWMSYIDVFKLLKSIINTVVYDPLFDDIVNSLKQWGTVYSAIKDNSDLIPATASALIRVWEKTANLSESFGNVTEIYEEDLNSNITNLSKVIEPVMLVVIWWLVVVIALWVFWVITSIMDAVNI